MTYVNHIHHGEGWKELSDMGKVFSIFNWEDVNLHFLPIPESVNWRTNFALPNKTGRLHLTIKIAFLKNNGQRTILFELTARGLEKESPSDAMWKWFDLAHEWIVRGFTDITTPEIQRSVWRRKR